MRLASRLNGVVSIFLSVNWNSQNFHICKLDYKEYLGPFLTIRRWLAHTIGDKVEAAYRRGDLFEKRKRMMDDWAKFCATVVRAGKVVAINSHQR